MRLNASPKVHVADIWMEKQEARICVLKTKSRSPVPSTCVELLCQTVKRRSCAGSLVGVSPRNMSSSSAYLLVTFQNDSQATSASLFANDRDLISWDIGIDVAAAVLLDLEDALSSLLSPGNTAPDAAVNINDPHSCNL